MAEDSAIFQVRGVTKRYGSVTALDKITLSVSSNEYVSLLGPSGSGKTTLLRNIAGFETPDEGRVYFHGRDITALPAYQRGIGFVFQNFALFPHLSVFANVAFGLVNGAARISQAEIRERTHDMIALVGLSGMESRGVNQISGGQRQRVALARTLVTAPQLVLLDEPLGALDANLRHRMRDELRLIREKLGVTFLHVTGSESEALAMGDRIIILDRGQVAQFATPAQVFAAPASPNVAHHLNGYNLFDGRVSGKEFIGPFGKLKVGAVTPSARPVYAVRCDLMRAGDAETARDRPSLPATFIASEYLGSSVMHFFETGDGKVVEVEHHLSMGAPQVFEPKTQYTLSWEAGDAIVFG